LTIPAVVEAEVIHVYWPLPDRGEIDTRLLIAALRGRGADVVLPVVTSFDPETPTLEHRRYEGPNALMTNRWGIREPVNTERVSPEAIDAVLVPALGADRHGHRLGHGSGYYDAFLQSVSCPRIALVYDACVVPSLPSAPHDVPMTTLVTEQNVIEICA
jgi:5-formyltetrahydrofolate cyclo-ligase